MAVTTLHAIYCGNPSVIEITYSNFIQLILGSPQLLLLLFMEE